MGKRNKEANPKYVPQPPNPTYHVLLLTPTCLKAHARALFSTTHPYGSEYDVVHTYDRENEDNETPYNTHLILYTKPHKSEEWERVHSVDGNADVAGGLTDLLESLRHVLRQKLDRSRTVPGTSERNDGVDNAPEGSTGKDADADGRGKKRRHSRRRDRSRSRRRRRSRSHGRGRSRSPDRSRSR